MMSTALCGSDPRNDGLGDDGGGYRLEIIYNQDGVGVDKPGCAAELVVSLTGAYRNYGLSGTSECMCCVESVVVSIMAC